MAPLYWWLGLMAVAFIAFMVILYVTSPEDRHLEDIVGIRPMLGLTAKESIARPLPPEIMAPLAQMGAGEFSRRVGELKTRTHLWSDILQTLNPDNDSEAQRLLEDFRGLYPMFNPLLALYVLEIG